MKHTLYGLYESNVVIMFYLNYFPWKKGIINNDFVQNVRFPMCIFIQNVLFPFSYKTYFFLITFNLLKYHFFP